MSIKAMSWAFELTIPPAQKLVLLAVCDCTNEDTGLTIPGQKFLAEKSSMSERTIRTHLGWLEEHGYITREARMREDGRGRTSDSFIVHHDQAANLAARRPTGKSASDQAAGSRTTKRQSVAGESEENQKVTLGSPANSRSGPTRTQPSTPMTPEELHAMDHPEDLVDKEKISELRGTFRARSKEPA